MEVRHTRTGGADRHWVFDPTSVEGIAPIMNKLVHYDEYFAEEQEETTLTIIIDKLLEDLPEEIRVCTSLVYLSGVSYRSAGRTLNIDHKTVKSRANKGVAMLRSRLKDTAWVATLLDGMLPEESSVDKLSSPEKVVGILTSLNKKGQ